MASSINLSLTDELKEFIDQNCGDGTLYSTPSEFLRSLLREKKAALEAAEVRDAVLQGYHDIAAKRYVRYTGSLKETLKKSR